jgi:iron complex transport system substrate-binding protein
MARPDDNSGKSLRFPRAHDTVHQTNLTIRIISLLPAATEIVAALGALDQLVGITHECDFPAEVNGIPRVTTSLVDRDASSRAIDESVRALSASGAPVFALDADQLRRLAPTVILTQSLCEVCAVSEGDIRSLGAVLDPAPRLVSLGGTTLDGVWEDITAVGTALGRGREASDLLAAIAARMRAVHETLAAARAPRPRVAVIEWLDPLFVAGHWTPELVRRAGGIDVLAEPGAHSVEIPVDRIRDAQPELLLFAPCGFDAHRAARECTALLATAEWRWAKGIEAWAIDGNALTSRPGPRLADAVAVMAGIIAPASFPAPFGGYALRVLTP